MFKTTQARFTLLILGFFVLLLLITVVVIKLFVAPQLATNESRLVRYEVENIGSSITQLDSTTQHNAAQAMEEQSMQLERVVSSFKL